MYNNHYILWNDILALYIKIFWVFYFCFFDIVYFIIKVAQFLSIIYYLFGQLV